MNPKDILAALAASANSVELAPGIRINCLSAPSEVVNVRAIFRAVEYYVNTLPPANGDDLPVSDLDDQLKAIQNVVGKIATQRQRNAALIGLQQAPAFRAILSLVAPDGTEYCKKPEDEQSMLRIFELHPAKIQAVEQAVGWDKFDAERKAKAEAEAAKAEKKEGAEGN